MKNKVVNLTFIADTHHFSRTLSADGRAYDLRSGSDQKCLNETGGIIDAAFSKIKNSDTDAVMIVGDLTNNGEKASHEEFREKLYDLQKSKPVYVITATHDWCCDENPRKFSGNAVYHNVPTLNHEELRDFYFDFGSGQALSEFITHLGTCSYTVDIGENVRLLALNDDQNGKGRAGFKQEHFKWIEEQIEQAKNDGKILVGMEHHLLIPHIHPLVTGGSTCVGDREYVASRLADAGLRYMFVGHSHIQRIDSFTSEKGNTITEINVGSLCGYPAPIVNVEIGESGLKINTDYVESFEFDGKRFNAEIYLKNKIYALVDRVLDGAEISKSEFCDRLTALQLNGEEFAALYPLAHIFAKYIKKETALGLYKKLKLFGLADSIRYSDVLDFKDKPVIEFVHEILLSFFDGGIVKHGEETSYYGLVMGVCDALVKLRACSLTLDIRQLVHHILVGSEPDINSCVLSVK